MTVTLETTISLWKSLVNFKYYPTARKTYTKSIVSCSYKDTKATQQDKQCRMYLSDSVKNLIQQIEFAFEEELEEKFPKFAMEKLPLSDLYATSIESFYEVTKELFCEVIDSTFKVTKKDTPEYWAITVTVEQAIDGDKEAWRIVSVSKARTSDPVHQLRLAL